MSIARYLSKFAALLGSDGKVPAAGLATGAVVGQLGFTPAVGNGAYGTFDFNTATTSGMYRVGSGCTNKPPYAGDYGQLLVMHGASDTITQIYGEYGSGMLWCRSGNPPDVSGSGSWSAWMPVNSIGGSGQGWTDVTASRAFGTTYTNTTGRPIQVAINSVGSSSSSYVHSATVNGVQIHYCNNNYFVPFWNFIVPPGGTYSATTSGGVGLGRWAELR